MEYTLAGILTPDYASRSDPEIIEACLNGDSRAWEALVTRYQRLIYTIPLRYGLSESDAADIFQAVCVILLQNLSRLRDRKRLGAWLVVTTRRECWRLARQRQQGATNLDVALLENKPTDEPKPEESFVHQERQALVRAAVERLDSRCRRLVTLLFYTEPRPSYEEIMQTLGLPEGSIGPTRARCLEKLTDMLSKMGFFD